MQLSDTTNLYGITQDIYFEANINASSFAANDLLRIINKYYLQLQDAIRSVNENFYMAEATADLYIGDGSYTFPDGTGTAPPYEKVKSIWAAYAPANSASPLSTEFMRVDIVDPDSITNTAYTFNPDKPKAMVFGNYFVLLPLVTDVTKYPVTGGVKMYYIPENNLLANVTDVPLIFPSFHDAITIGSLIDVFKRLGDDENSEKYAVRFKQRLEEVKSYASERIPPEISLIEGQDTQGGWDFPWGKTSMA